eukprot:JP435885.1.p1 GENE.JP435885.1~~JP435885.1.p1  ORF type:complete len:304 (-),score=141.86 JP435885.1:279-1190(-)
MVKMSEKVKEQSAAGKPWFSLEYFPPKTPAGVENLHDRVERMTKLNPLFIDVTWGAGGSTADLTIDLCTAFQKKAETQMHLTCTNMQIERAYDALEKAKAAGIQNILALRGDPPAGQEKWEVTEGGFANGVDLVKYIREKYGDYFSIAVAGYPEGHIEAESYEKDLQYLKEKVDAGADMVITQLFYDVDLFLKWVQDCRDIGIKVPIIPGIMPINTYGGFTRMTGFCKTKIPQAITDALEPIKDDEEAVKAYGVKLGIEMCKKILDAGVSPGVHMYTLNLEKSVVKILEGLGMVPAGSGDAAN